MTKTKEYIQAVLSVLMGTGAVHINQSPAFVSNGWGGTPSHVVEALPAHELLTLLRRCYKATPISVIKAVREAHGLSLRDAKDFCDNVRDGAVRVTELGNITSIRRIAGSELWEVKYTLNGEPASFCTKNPPHPTDHLSVQAEPGQ